jgi:hypothetical protein
MSADELDAVEFPTAGEDSKRGDVIPVGGGKPVQAKTLVGTAVRCPDCSTGQRQVAAEITSDGGWACWSCGSTGTAEQMLGNPWCVLRSGTTAPWIIDPTGKVVQYRRASSATEVLEDAYAFHARDKRALVVGMLRSTKSLLLRVDGVLRPDVLVDDLTKQEKEALDEIIVEAMRTGGVWLKADLGTLMHKVAEHHDTGLDGAPDFPAEQAATLAARRQILDGHDVRWFAREKFVVNDEMRMAGSFDGLGAITLPDSTRIPAHLRGQRVVCIFDDKWSRHLDLAGMAYAAQQAVYDGGSLYNPATGERVPLSSLVPEDETAPWCSELSVILNQPAGGRVSHLVPVPLDEGRSAVMLALDLSTSRNSSKRWLAPAATVEIPQDEAEAKAASPTVAAPTIPVSTSPVDRISDLIAAAASVPDLVALREREMAPVDYGKPGPDGVHVPKMVVHWTAEHEALAAARAATLAPLAPPLLEQVAAAVDMPTLIGLYQANVEHWTPELDEAAKRRAGELGRAAA